MALHYVCSSNVSQLNTTNLPDSLPVDRNASGFPFLLLSFSLYSLYSVSSLEGLEFGNINSQGVIRTSRTAKSRKPAHHAPTHLQK